MKTFIEKLFSKDKINTGRQYEFDLTRGFTLILLCICHVGLFLTNDTKSGLYYFCDLIGSEPIAPVLMILLGICVIFSKKQNPIDFFKRGLTLFICGYILNIFRSFPYWFCGKLNFFACVNGFFVVDIFQFAGLSFMIFGLFKKIKIPYWGMFILSIVFLIAGNILMAFPNAIDFKEPLTYFLNLFLPLNNDWCCFNLLTWFIYPCFGLMLGELLIRCKNKDKFYLILLILGIIGMVTLYLNIGLRFPNYTSYYFGNNYYRMGVFNSLVTILVFCFFLSFWYFVGKVLPKHINKFLSFLSKNISSFYVASWVFLAPIMHIQSFNKLTFPVIAIIGLMFATILFSLLFSLIYKKIKNHFLHKGV